VRGLSGFDRRLDPTSHRPLAVAFSGGGDSLALLLMSRAWADACGRQVLALTVDHGLQAASAGWTEQCRATAARLGVEFQPLAWTGEKPAAGLPAAARTARHRLLADAARKAGACVLLMGHTADDVLEAGVMRGEGSTVGDPREWAPSPAWPEGRGVFILRPLLDQRRAALRDWLTSQGETWIDDPANEDPRSSRARARTSLSAHPGDCEAEARSSQSRDPVLSPIGLAAKSLGPGFRQDERGDGVLVLPRKLSQSQIAAACLSAAGTTTPPRGERLARLAEQVNGDDPFTATLAGARIEADASAVRFMRNAGESARGGLAPLDLTAHEPVVWDGRFEITAERPGLTVAALKGHAARLPASERDALKAIPAAARPALPVLVGPSGVVLARPPTVQVRSLVLERFSAAVGLVKREADL